MKKSKEREAKYNKMCVSSTSFLEDKLFAPIGIGAAFIGKILAWPFKMFWNVVKFFAVLITHVWILIVAGKKKACPYIPFKD